MTGLANGEVTGVRFTVSIRYTGLGDRLICLAAAWLFARNTGRTLVIDWRFGDLSRNWYSNDFIACFRNSGHLAGVPIICDNSVAQLKYPTPRYPFIWNHKTLLQRPMSRPTDLMEVHRRAAVNLIRAKRDRPEPVVVFDACINDGIVRFEDAREFYQALEPVEPVAEHVEEFRRQRFEAAPVIGLHIRHGNGGDVMGHTKYWTSFSEAIARCQRYVDFARERLGSDAPVFLCTDSSDVEAAVRALVPGVFTRPKQFRPQGVGELHHGSDVWQRRDDALIEMLLLAHTKALIRYPPGTFFSLYGAVMKQRTGPPPETLYHLMEGFDRAEPLSPGLIL